MRRRDFINRMMEAAAAAAWVGAATETMAAASGADGQRRPPRRRRQPAANRKLERVCISSWSFHNYFQSTREKDFNLPGEMLALLDFPESIADRYHVHNLE